MAYDNICKRLAELYPQSFASWLLGQPVDDVEVLKTELSNDPIQADSLILLKLIDCLLHIEFQTTPRSDPPVPFRMLDYWVREYRKYRLPIIQFVVVLTESGEDISTEFRAPNTWHRFNVVNVWQQEATSLLAIPALLPLAVLARTDDPPQLLEAVVERALEVEPVSARGELLTCAHFLGGLRFDQQMLKILIREEIMEQSVTFQEFKQRFLQQGEMKGEMKGELSGALRTVRRLLTHRFGQLAPETEKRLADLNLNGLESLSDTMLDFQHESELADWLDRYKGSQGDAVN